MDLQVELKSKSLSEIVLGADEQLQNDIEQELLRLNKNINQLTLPVEKSFTSFYKKGNVGDNKDLLDALSIHMKHMMPGDLLGIKEIVISILEKQNNKNV